MEIAAAGRWRFLRDYAAIPLWENFVVNLESHLTPETDQATVTLKTH
jgi:hypothetical protein